MNYIGDEIMKDQNVLRDVYKLLCLSWKWSLIVQTETGIHCYLLSCLVFVCITKIKEKPCPNYCTFWIKIRCRFLIARAVWRPCLQRATYKCSGMNYQHPHSYLIGDRNRCCIRYAHCSSVTGNHHHVHRSVLQIHLHDQAQTSSSFHKR